LRGEESQPSARQQSRIAQCDNLRGVFVELPIEPAKPDAGEKEARNFGFPCPDRDKRESG